MYCLNSVLYVKAVVAAFNQEKALVGTFSVITNLQMKLFEALVCTKAGPESWPGSVLGPDITPALGWAGLLGTPETGNVQIPTKTKGRWI